MTTGDSNGRVTMAILATKIDGLSSGMSRVNLAQRDMQKEISDLVAASARRDAQIEQALSAVVLASADARAAKDTADDAVQTAGNALVAASKRDPFAYIAGAVFAAFAGIGSTIFGGKG